MNTFKKLKAITKENTFTVIEAGEGSEKLSADLRYIFEERISIGRVVSLGLSDAGTASSDVAVWSAEQGNSDASNGSAGFRRGSGPYICCTYDRRRAKKELADIGLIYKKDYYFAEDLFCLLDDMKECRIAFVTYDRSAKGFLKKIIFGYAAKHGKKLPDKYSSASVLYLILGLPHILCQTLSKNNLYKDYDRICFLNATDAVRFKNDHPEDAHKVITLETLQAHTLAPSYMREVYFDRRQNTCACVKPLKTLWVGRNGSARLCDCPDFLDVSIGDIGVTNLTGTWESPVARIIRLSVINNTYTFCSHSLCSSISKSAESNELLERKKVHDYDRPYTINFASDYSCNLHCPSCRRGIHAKNDADEDMVIDSCINDLANSGWLDKADTLLVGGGGEVFLSEHYKRVLYDTGIKRNKITIMTNATLFTPMEWEKLEGKYEHINFMVSVDAATKKTYEKVRCGGSFERLMKNMDFLSDLRKKNKVDKVTVILIVQRANYKEIPDFIRWAKDKGFDNVNLSHIRNWGSFDDRDFSENVSMFDKNSKIKPELAAVLKDPACCDEIVSMSWNPD